MKRAKVGLHPRAIGGHDEAGVRAARGMEERRAIRKGCAIGAATRRLLEVDRLLQLDVLDRGLRRTAPRCVEDANGLRSRMTMPRGQCPFRIEELEPAAVTACEVDR